MSSQLDREWEEFFGSGFYQKGWDFTKDDAVTQHEVDGVIELLSPPDGAHILDWCGGWGRHAIELAKRGYEVTLLDFAANHIDLARSLAVEAEVNLNLVNVDFRETPVSIQADFAINMFTAGLGYYTREDDIKALVSLHRALKPGAKFLIDTMNLFWLVKNYQPMGWRESEDKRVRLFGKRKFDFWSNRNRSEETLSVRGEQEREMVLDHYIYSPSELAAVLKIAGFETLALYGDFYGQEFSFDTRKIVMISEK